MLLILALAACTSTDGDPPGPSADDTGPTPTDSRPTDPPDSVPTDTSVTPPAEDERCDGVDNDLDGDIDEEVDADGDGWEDCAADCDPTRSDVHPGASEVDNGRDDDCDGLVDEGHWAAGDLVVTELLVDPTHTLDRDGEWIEVVNVSGRDVYLPGLTIDTSRGTGTVAGDPVAVPPGGRVLVGVNSDTSRNGSVVVAATWSGAELDNEGGTLELRAEEVVLDGVSWPAATPGVSRALDPGASDASTNDEAGWWCDADTSWAAGDAGSPGAENPPCPTLDRDGDGYTGLDGDCDDTAADIHPGAEEVPYDGVDANCDPTDDDDADGDGEDAEGAGGADCDDEDPARNPSAPETCDGVDNDCDGLVDDADAGLVDAPVWSPDADGDGYGGDTSGVSACVGPAGYAELGGDCDDADVALHPGATEICGNGLDDDCDGGAGSCGLEGLRSVADGDGAVAGPAAGAYCGWALADAGDLTGDGVSDLVVASPAWSGSVVASGRVDLWAGFGSGSPSAVATIEGDTASDQLGQAVRGAGDVDGDGAADLLVSATAAEVVNGGEGVAWLFLGPLAGTLTPADAAVDLFGAAASDAAGTALGAADVDGDGTRELLVSALGNDDAGSGAGAVFVVDWLGAPLFGLADATLSLTGERPNDFVGRAVTAIDWDGDGVDEVATTSTDADIFAGNAGALWVADASGSGVESLSSARVVVHGVESDAGLGKAMVGGRDIDGDGLDDLLVGSPGATGSATDAGAAYVVLGGSASGPITDAWAVLLGVNRNDGFGASVAFAPDLDGDGVPDALVGASGSDAGGSNAGEARVFYGPLAGTLTSETAFLGAAAGDSVGDTVTGLADQDGDGDDELVVGAPYADDGGASAGAFYWLLGGPGM